MYDAIVVGARCAGSPTAMLLARKGYRVLLLDRATFPSDIMSTHFIKQAGVTRLQRWGLADRLAATGCPPVPATLLDYGDFALRGIPTPAPGMSTVAYAPRRTVLDALLAEAAVEAGAELRQGFVVDELLMDGDQVIGVRGHDREGGAPVTERARIVIGADGRHSLVARAVNAPRYKETPPLECGYYSYWSGVPATDIEIYVRERRLILIFPTHHGRVCAMVGAPIDEFPAFRADIEGFFFRGLDLVPALAARVRAGRREERWTGTADLPNFFRKPYGPGWALVGDAGYHKDPATGEGISDAFRDAELLAEAIDAGFSGLMAPGVSEAEPPIGGLGASETAETARVPPLEQALARYQRQRDAASMATYEKTLRWASHTPLPAEERALLRAISASQHDTDRFFGVTAGTVPAEEFFAPENLARIMAAARESAPVG